MFGFREAAWPLIRAELNLSYEDIGLLLTIPNVIATFIELVIGALGDTRWRRTLILGGGVVFACSTLLIALSAGPLALLLSFILLYPASGAFINLAQAALMDVAPTRHEQNMARWTLAGSIGIVAGPLLLGLTAAVGWSWRSGFVLIALLALVAVVIAARFRYPVANEADAPLGQTLAAGFRGAWQTLRRREIIRWLTLLQFSDLMLDVLHAYLALYFVDVVGVTPLEAGLAVGVWTGVGLLGDVLLLPLVERVQGLAYLRVSALLVLLLFPAFLLLDGILVKLVILGLLGLLNAGWYAILQAQLYGHLPGQSGSVMALSTVSGLIGGMVPLGIGLMAESFGLQVAFWFLLLGPIAMLIGLPSSEGWLKDVEMIDD